MKIAIPDTWLEARNHLLPVLRRATDPADPMLTPAHLASEANPENILIRRPFLPLLSQLLVIDRREYRTYVKTKHLHRWEVTIDEAFQWAAQTIDPTDGLTRRSDGLYHLASDDGYQSSRLLLSHWLNAFTSHLARPVAAVPDARVLLVGDADDVQQLEKLVTLADHGFRNGGKPISPVLYGPDKDGALIVWRPPKDHPLRPAQEFAQRHLAAYEYSNQRYNLSELVEEEIAKVTLSRNKATRRSFTYCRWKKGRSTLLAQTDYIIIESPEADDLVLPMTVFLEHCPDLLRRTEFEPTLYATLSWPPPSKMTRLRQLGTTVS
ncbi:MAG: hypothetical protein HN348_24225 [Proteobacteria bacterium]|nr:hypothetical protein [Pseudomonadota bacterium]